MSQLPTLKQARDDLFEKALAKHNGHVVSAAAEVGITYATLYRWISKKSSCKVTSRGA